MGVQWGLFVKLRVGDRDKQQVFGIICLRQKCAPKDLWFQNHYAAMFLRYQCNSGSSPGAVATNLNLAGITVGIRCGHPYESPPRFGM